MIPMTDDEDVSAPRHYRGDGIIECMDAMRSMMTIDNVYKTMPEVRNGETARLQPIVFYWWGCAFKYLWRWIWKNGVQDLRKCRQCIDYLIDVMEVDDEQDN
jgi:hypothetical protein